MSRTLCRIWCGFEFDSKSIITRGPKSDPMVNLWKSEFQSDSPLNQLFVADVFGVMVSALRCVYSAFGICLIRCSQRGAFVKCLWFRGQALFARTTVFYFRLVGADRRRAPSIEGSQLVSWATTELALSSFRSSHRDYSIFQKVRRWEVALQSVFVNLQSQKAATSHRSSSPARLH